MKHRAVQHDIAIAILAGGKSSRMGAPKAGALLTSGETLFDRVYHSVSSLKLPCVVVGHAEGINLKKYTNTTVIPDAIPERGPVGALLGLLRSEIAHHYLVIACDQPLLSMELLNKLLIEINERPTVFMEPNGSNISPLPGLYPATLLPIVETLLKQPRASLRELLSLANVRTIPLASDEWMRLRSANTPQDIHDINAQLSQS